MGWRTATQIGSSKPLKRRTATIKHYAGAEPRISLGSGYVKDRQSEDSYDRYQLDKAQQPEGLEDKMPFYPPSDAVK
jgi:hypothetical protein